jgi:D-tyrosyl-tRNA(Tyr) deacylase
MIAVVQRVLEARVVVAGEVVGQIGRGLAVLAAVEAADTEAQMAWVAGKLVGLRIFRQGEKHFDRDLQQMAAEAGARGRGAEGTGAGAARPGILLVSNFTVAAETAAGRRPSLSGAAAPQRARELFDRLVLEVRRQVPHLAVETGRFGADMQVHLINDGPATFLVESVK